MSIDLKKRTFAEMIAGSEMGKMYDHIIKIYLDQGKVPPKTAKRMAAMLVITTLQQAKNEIED